MKEDKFITQIKSLLPESAGLIGDDTAYIPDRDLILTQDTLIEDVHFRRGTISPFDLGIKSVAVNLSDIAASGGVPGYLLISISLPENIEDDFVSSFYKGVHEICTRYKVLVAGGDLTRASKINISIAAIGFADGIKPATRSYAEVGDFVVVTGKFGSSRAGLWLLESRNEKAVSEDINNIPEELKTRFIKSHVNPVPKLQEGRSIVETCQNPPAMMDSSDGLADALYKICLQSRVGMEINYNEIPVDADLNYIANLANINPARWVLYGGEDYELVGTVKERDFQKLQEKGIPVKVIGKVVQPSNSPAAIVNFEDHSVIIDSNNLDAEAFSHFK